jgi:hypothetical protein
VTLNGGKNFQSANEGLDNNRHWDMQYIISNHDPYTLYTGTSVVYKSSGSALPQWLPISDTLVDYNVDALRHQITTLSESPIEKNILYVGTTDGQVWNSLDGGTTWNKINSGLPMRYVSSIKASPSFKNKVYVTLTGYRDNDNKGHIFMSENNGVVWKDISSNLPPLAINDVLIYPDGSDQILFVATDGGIYISTNAGSNWDRLGDNMPFIPVYDLEYNIANNQLVAGTFARGIQSFDLMQLGIDINTSAKEIKAKKWTVYPSITCDIIHIEGNVKGNIDILDLHGRLIKSIKAYNTIDLSNLSSGIYYLQNTDEVKKIIKL